MNLKQELIATLPGIDENGNQIERNKDIVVITSLNDNGNNFKRRLSKWNEF